MGVNPVLLTAMVLSPATSDAVIPLYFMMGISGGVMLVCIVLTVIAKVKARRENKDQDK